MSDQDKLMSLRGAVAAGEFTKDGRLVSVAKVDFNAAFAALAELRDVVRESRPLMAT